MLTESKDITFEYRIRSEDEEIGFVQAKTSISELSGERIFHRESVVQFQLDDSLLGSDSTEVETVLLKGKNLQQYEGIAQKNGKRSTMSIRLVADLLVLDYAQGGKKKLDLLELSDFDCTSEYLVDHFLSSGERASTYQVFDLRRFDVEEVEVILIKDPEVIEAAGRQWECRVILIQNHSHSISHKRWLYNIEGQWVMIKEVEKESDNEAIILLHAIKTDIELINSN